MFRAIPVVVLSHHTAKCRGEGMRDCASSGNDSYPQHTKADASPDRLARP